MSTPRFYYPGPLASHQAIDLPDDLSHHAVRVLRMRDGQDIILFNGEGGHYPATLIVEGKRGRAQLGAHADIEAELDGDITLAQGIPSGAKMDWVVEKAVELGVRRLVPISAQRSVLQLSGDRLEKRLAHWRRVAQAASEQCGRNRLMEVTPPHTLEAFLARGDHGTLIMCDPDAERPFADVVQQAGNQISLLVGPEGGWSEAESALASNYGIEPVVFGKRILRSETAGLALIAAVVALRGWG